jgi:hypothetical protein
LVARKGMYHSQCCLRDLCMRESKKKVHVI